MATGNSLEHSGRRPDRLERFASACLGTGGSVAIALTMAVLLAFWIPQYLLWPWWPDLDAFAMVARAWDRGILPYRDIVGFNFPGQTYLFWILGHTFGWGKTWPIYLVDVALLVGVLAAMVGWSRRVLGRALPGWAGGFTFLLYYLGLDYTNVAQRDWQAIALVVLGLLTLQARPGRRSVVVAAACFALAMVFRPYAILFVPAVLFSLSHCVQNEAVSGRRWNVWSVRASWLGLFGAFTLLMFAPLFWNGLFGDFLEALATPARRNAYGSRQPLLFVRNLVGQVWPGDLALFAGLAIAWRHADAKARATIRPWLAATAAAFLYRSIAPMDHLYLRHPLRLMLAVDVALILGVVLSVPRLAAPERLWVVLLVIGAGSLSQGPRTSIDPRSSVYALRAVIKGEQLEKPPIGVELDYAWDDYRKAVDYVRTQTGPDTRLANLLRRGAPSFCGPTDRLPVFPVETPAIAWLWLNRLHTEDDFVNYLDRSDDSVVIWAPDEESWTTPSLPNYPRLVSTVKRDYTPVARFGEIQVWKRNTSTLVSSKSSLTPRAN